MIRHVVIFRWKPGTAASAVDHLEDGLRGLPAAIPQLRRYVFGRDLGLVEGNGDFGVVADCDDEAGWRAYLDHPRHVEVVRERLRPLMEQRVAVQLRLD